MRYRICMLGWCLSCCLLFAWSPCCRPVQAAVAKEQLIVLIQDRPTLVAQSFEKDLLPQIKQLARELGVGVDVRKITGQAPVEVAVTPLIVYQNHRGRSIYQGRSNTLSRIRNFIRTARHVPQGAEGLLREQTAVRQMGRAKVWAPVKITALTGSKPEGFDENAFRDEALQSIYQGFRYFKVLPKVMLGRADRGFYLDFYPWLSKEGMLFLSLGIFSQFHCKIPVFHTGDKPLTGRWEDRNRLFQEAARRMETVVQEKIADAFNGDGFDPVDDRVTDIGWEEFGYPLPALGKKETAPILSGEIPRRWKLLKTDSNDPPLAQFRFPPPLDNYAGEATKGEGEFNLPADLKPGAASGFVNMDVLAVTMGQKDLDQFLRSSMLLDAVRFPIASFTITTGADEGEKPVYGRLTRVAYTGDFSMKGKTLPLNAAMEIEPIITDKGEKRLLIQGNFQIDLNFFDIQGPDGPDPANHIMLFDVNFVLGPAEPEKTNGNSSIKKGE